MWTRSIGQAQRDAREHVRFQICRQGGAFQEAGKVTGAAHSRLHITWGSTALQPESLPQVCRVTTKHRGGGNAGYPSLTVPEIDCEVAPNTELRHSSPSAAY